MTSSLGRSVASRPEHDASQENHQGLVPLLPSARRILYRIVGVEPLTLLIVH